MEEKPFACDWPGCSYRSVRACDVSNHKLTHTGEKRFVCEFPNCGKGFARSHHLKVCPNNSLIRLDLYNEFDVKRHQSTSHTIIVEEEGAEME